MKKLLKIAGFFAVALVLLVAAASLAVYYLIQAGELRRVVISELEKRTRLKAHVGSAEVSLGRVSGVSFREFVLLEPETGRPVITSERVWVRVALMALLERRLDFYEIRFQRPTLKLAREQGVEAGLLDLLLPLLSPAQQGSPLALDLRQIKIDGGEMVVFDRREGEPSGLVEIHDIDATLRRPAVSGAPASEGAPARPAATDARAVEFALKAAVQRGGDRGRLESRGKMLFPDGDIRAEQIWLDAETRVTGMPVGFFADYAAAFVPLRATRGVMGSRLRWRGAVGQQLQVKGAVELRDLEIDAPQIFAAALAPREFRLEVELDWRRDEMRILRMDGRADGISVSIRGSLRGGGEADPEIQLRFATPFLPIVKARQYLPLGVLGASAAGPWIDAVAEGEISVTAGGVAGRFSELRGFSDPGSIWIEAELHDVAGRPPGDGELGWRGVSGRVSLERGTLHFKGISGSYGNSWVSDLNGAVRGWIGGAAALELRARGDLDLEELRRLIGSKGGGSPAAEASARLRELSGRAKFDMALRKAAASPYHAEGHLMIDGARMSVAEFPFSQISGELAFTPREIRFAKLSGELAGSPVQASGRLGLTGKSAFDLRFDSGGVRAGLIARALLGSGAAGESGTIGGSIRYQGSLAGGEKTKVSGSLDLSGVQVPWLPQPARDLGGKLRFDDGNIDFQGLTGRFAGSAFELRGQWRQAERPQLIFSLYSPEMDLGPLFSAMDGAPGDWYQRLQAKGRVTIKKGKYDRFEFSDLQTDLVLDKRTWRLSDFAANASGGSIQGSGTITEGPGNVGFAVDSKIQGVPVEGLLGWFDMKTAELTGRVHLSGRLASSGETGAERKRNLSGAFRLVLEDGVIRRLRVLVNILSLVDLSRWFTLRMPDVNQEGIRFRRITGDFKVSGGVYSTENLLVDGDDLRLTGAGKVDGAEGNIEFVVAVRPFPGLSSAVRSIPLIGRGLAAIKNSLLVASFRVGGTVDNPIVIPAPLSTLSEFFFGALEIPKSLIGLSEEEPK